MARLIGVSTALLLAAGIQAQTEQDRQFKEAGVCARCHVISVVEWGMSKHRAAGTDCVKCHGASLGHVADERNNVKPQNIPHGAAVTKLCQHCHTTQKRDGCDTCHHVHALVNPKQPAVAPQVTMDQPAPAPAARLRPRRTALPGFDIQGTEFEAASGLPRRVIVSGLGISMALVPGGDFEMGSDHLKYAQPVHTVRVAPFYLAEFDLTQAEWTALMGSNPSVRQGAKMPVENVSWKDAQAFVAAINGRVPGGGFRLPTEAEWEFAARSELQGMLGEVWQWCSSLSRSYPYDPNDGREDLDAAGLRILRGGSYADSEEWSDPGARHAVRSEVRLKWNGMRLARSIPE